MKIVRIQQIKDAYHEIRNQGISMRRRFVLFLLAMLCAVIAFLILLLNLFGVINPADDELHRIVDQQLDYTAETIFAEMDELTALAIEFSEQISNQLERNQRQGISFDKLKNDVEELTAFQKDAYHTVYTYLRLAPCSGAFCFIDSTVNDGLSDTYYNGIYLKYANLFTENTIRNKVCMYRGASEVARNNDINLHSTWQYELLKGTFPELEGFMDLEAADPVSDFRLTTVYQLPDAWERVRFLCVPVVDNSDRIIGVCGFEISNLLFGLSNETSAQGEEHIICALLTKDEDGYVGQIAGNRSGYTPYSEERFTVTYTENYAEIVNGGTKFIGSTREIRIGDSEHLISVMTPRNIHDEYVKNGQLKAIGLFLVVGLVALLSSLWISKHYVAPILQGVERLKEGGFEPFVTGIPEIDDLFGFLDQKDREHEEEIRRLEDEKLKVQSQYDQAQTYLTHLSEEKIPKVDQDSFEQFLECLHTLTPKEREIFDLYLEGKKAKEIMELTSINQNTMKYHNKNIYSKLGVTSRKQLMEYAALLKIKNEIRK